jgi:hypothetical protein
LIFPGIGCSLKSRLPLGFPNANIVTGGHKIDPARVCKLNETSQFDALVASDTGIGRCPFEIAGYKVVDHAGTKGFPGVDHLMRDLQYLCDISGNTDLAAATFFPALRGCDRFVFVLPDLKCDTTNVVALAYQKGCGDRAVHSTAHAKENSRASHRGAIVLRREEKG